MKRNVEMQKARLKSLHRAALTSFLKWGRRSNVARWNDVAQLNEAWDTRTEMLADFVPPGASVIEFGAGRMVLPQYLPAGCTYTPSDLVDRGANTFVCDLNCPPLPPFPGYDVAVFSGVLEYVNDLSGLILHLARYCQMIVASYAVTDYGPQSGLVYRRAAGWVNDYGSLALKQLFSECGYRCEQMATWNNQRLFQFVRTEC